MPSILRLCLLCALGLAGVHAAHAQAAEPQNRALSLREQQAMRLPAKAPPAPRAAPRGVLCIGPISAHAVVDEMSGAPAHRVGKPLPRYAVQVDRQPTLQTHNTHTVAVPLEGDRHWVQILADGRPEQGFSFRFSAHGGRALHLQMSEVGYQTWQLRPGPDCR